MAVTQHFSYNKEKVLLWNMFKICPQQIVSKKYSVWAGNHWINECI